MSSSLWPHRLQHARLPCPSPTPGACSNSCTSSRWCHPTISSSVIPFSPCLQSFPASGSFSMSQFFTSGDQIIGVSASASVFPMNIQDWFPLGLTDLISLQSKVLSRVFSSTTIQKASILRCSAFFFLFYFIYLLIIIIIIFTLHMYWFCHTSPTLTSIHDHWKNHSFD